MKACTQTMIVWFVASLLTMIFGLYLATTLLPDLLGSLIATFVMVMVPMWIALEYLKRRRKQ